MALDLTATIPRRPQSDLSLCGRSRLLLTPSPDGPFGLGSASLSAGVQRLLPSVFASRGPASRPEAGRASGSFSLSRILSWFDPFEWYYWLTGDHDDGDDVSQDAGRRDPTPGPHLPVSSKAGAGRCVPCPQPAAVCVCKALPGVVWSLGL